MNIFFLDRNKRNNSKIRLKCISTSLFRNSKKRYGYRYNGYRFLVYMSTSEIPRANIFKDMSDNRAESRMENVQTGAAASTESNVLI